MSNYTDTLQRGDKIGCYRIEEVLGRGGFAVTYLATDENLDVEVAIKEYLPREITKRDQNLMVSARKQEFAEDYEVGLANFAREAKTLARFKHPNIVRVHQVLHANNTAYMVMDFERGQELGEILEKHETLPEEELRAILFPILDGVEEIHRHGFVHRDIKPSNIYVRHNGSPVLIDFGAARYTMSETTQQLTAVVTVGYTPIEQYNVSEDAQGPWSDIYALAAVCYEAVTGDVPTDSVTRASASVTKGDDPLATVRNLTKRNYSDDCLDAIDWGLRMEAEDRPQVIAQWRDSFDGIFNPASAYVVQKDVSIYSPHRVDKPRQSKAASVAQRQSARQSQTSAQRDTQSEDIVSIPLRATDTPLDTGVVSLDANRDSVVTSMPPPLKQDTQRDSYQADATQRNTQRNSDMPPIPGSQRVTEQPATHSANDGAPRNVLRRDTAVVDESIYQQNPEPPQSEPAPRKRSKLERPTHLADAPPAAKPRTLGNVRDEIEFDESDWDYEPPERNSSWKLILPALGLAAVVGASVMYVNFPDLITNLGNKTPELTTEQALTLAEQKLNASEFIFPAGESALDYYQLILESDPNNAEAAAGVRYIESAVREQIADNMKEDNLSEANRLLTRADKAGLTGLYGSSDTAAVTTSTAQQEPVQETLAPEAKSDDQSAKTEEIVVTPVDTASIEPTATSTASVVTTPVVTEQQPVITSTPAKPTTGIDNNLSPYILGKIAEIETLIKEERFSEARFLYTETDKFIPNPSVSSKLLSDIEAGELAQANAAAAETQSQSLVSDALAEPATNETATTITAPEPPRNSYIDGSGPGADHLDQLRLALEAKDIDAVRAISDSLPEGRIRFLNSTFARHHRLDVSIVDVTSNGDTVTARLNMAMFGRADDGSVYGAGKWNGAELTATRSNGVWQKIRW